MAGNSRMRSSASDGLYEAALVAVLAAALWATIGLVVIWLFSVGPAVGIIGSVVCPTLGWRWTSHAVRLGSTGAEDL